MHEVHTEDSVPPLSEKPRTRAARVVVEEGHRITDVEEIDDSMYDERGYQGLRGYTANSKEMKSNAPLHPSHPPDYGWASHHGLATPCAR